MTEYDNTNRGALFQKEAKSDKHPNMSGNINVDGKEYWLSGWTKVSKAGAKYLSLAIKPKEEQQAADGKDPDIPF